MNAFSRRTSFSAALFFRMPKRLALIAACVALAPAAAFASTNSIIVINPPNTSFSSGGNVGVIMVAEEDASGNIVTSAGGITLTVSGGTTAAGPYQTGTATGGITPTYVNGVATFDLSTVPLYAFSGGGTQTYTLTYADGTTSSISTTSTITVTVPTHLYIVTSFADPGTGSPACTDKNSAGFSLDANCTLRVALTAVKGLTAAQSATIAFSGTWPQTITLGSALSGVTWVAGLTIAGPGSSNLLISGGPGGSTGFAILKESSSDLAQLNLTGLTLENGYTTGNGSGLYLYAPATISNVTFLNNQANGSTGAAMYVNSVQLGTVSISNSTFQGNSNATSDGGALNDASNSGSLTINNSSFINNTTSVGSTTNGGAVSFTGKNTSGSVNALTITNSLFTGNVSTGNGGAVSAAITSTGTSSTNVTFTNDTFYSNTAGIFGGAVYVAGASAAKSNTVFTNVTAVGNRVTATGSGGGLYCSANCDFTLYNSIVGGNQLTTSATGNADVFYNTGNPFTITGNIYSAGVNPSPYLYPGLSALALSDLGYYGGPTQTLVPLPGSPALKHSSSIVGDSNNVDQRGSSRPISGSSTIDTGAVQTNPSFTFSAQPGNVNTGATFTPSPVVQYTDSGYTLATTAAPIPILMSLNAGTLSGTTTVNMTAGSATFSALTSNTAETSTTLTATAGTGSTKAQVTSNAFSITAVASTLVFTSLPTPILTAGNSSSSVSVNIEDGGGDTISGSSAQVNLAITGPAGYAGYNTNVNASSGVATFSGLPALTIPGSYTYTATSSGLTQATAPETVNINTTGLTLGESSSTNTYGTQDLLTATLSPASQGSASTNGEIVTFLNNGTSVGTGTLSGGTATLSTANLPTGPNSLTASYPGDPSFSSSTASALGETSTPAASSAVSAGTATATFTFTQNFTLGSITIVNTGTTGTAFTNSGGGTCAVSGSYGPGGTASCTVGLNYSASGGGLQTATVEVFDNNGVLQGVYNVVTPRYR